MAKKIKIPKDLNKFKDLVEKMYPQYFERIEESTKDELEWTVIDFSKKADVSFGQLEANEEIQLLREKAEAANNALSEAEGPFRDAINEFDIKRLFALRFMREHFPDADQEANLKAEMEIISKD
jgi:hypothetical protein